MKTLLTMVLFLGCVISSSASAGAWLREKGTGFASLSFGVTKFSETTNALYIEYGLSDSTTVGLDISAFTNSQNVRNGFGNLFLRRSLGRSDSPHKFAYEIGVGGLWGNEMQLPTLKTGVSWGRGLQMGATTGWVNVDAAFIYEPTLGEHIVKLDGTFGLNFTDRTTGILEINLSRQNDETFGFVEPSLLIRPRDSRFNIKLGAQIPVDDHEKSALKLGLWHSF